MLLGLRPNQNHQVFYQFDDISTILQNHQLLYQFDDISCVGGELEQKVITTSLSSLPLDSQSLSQKGENILTQNHFGFN